MARILVADDAEAIRELITDILGRQGHTIDCAGDGEEAFSLINENAYDLIVLDRNMPIMNGLELLKIIRLDSKLKTLKVLLFTSASLTQEINEGLAAGADGYLVKPLAISLFLDQITKILGK